MIRIAGVNLPENKRAVIALTYIEGIGLSTSKKILSSLTLDESENLSKVSEGQIEQIRNIIEKDYIVEGDLRVGVTNNVKRLKNIGTYRGLRHIKNLPVHGQRTKTNARTKRGKKITVGSGRKKAAEKT
ncbi:MAG: 30S ribosomal protein S13 [Nanoarchaeota archaeon]|nr:30S ribosomal protein S13 [Nanoarchaeota archaeon]